MTLRLRDIRNRRVVVWGHGSEGRAAVRVLIRHATPSTLAVVVDDPNAVSTGGDVAVLAGHDADVAIKSAEVIVKSPGVSPYHGRFAARPGAAEVTGGSALWFAETDGARTIGVTGSKGKSTTSSLIAHVLRVLGHDVTLAGNVGLAPLDVLDADLSSPPSPGRRYVFELSSFQTSELRNSPEIGVLTALFPEHLDWHESIDRYYADKCNLFAHRTDMQVAMNADNTDVAARMAAVSGTAPYGIDGSIHVDGLRVRDGDGSTVVDLDGAALRGRHNAINVAGALTALRLGGVDLSRDRDAIADAIRSFRPLAHRLEPVGTVGGRLVIDDGLSTAPQAAIAALAAFADRAVGIIVGGHDRGVDYEPLAEALAHRHAPAWVLGVPESGARIIPLVAERARAAGNHLYTEQFDDFDDAVARALALVPDGGVILLSPGAPSFGRFTDYVDRSRHFRELVGLP